MGGTSLTRRTNKSPASQEAGVSAKSRRFGLFADADHAHGARTVHLLHQIAVRRVVHVAWAVEAEAVAPAVMMTEAPRRSGGRGERGNAEGGNGGGAANGAADPQALLWAGFRGWRLSSGYS